MSSTTRTSPTTHIALESKSSRSAVAEERTQRFLLVLVLVGGMSSIGVELAASRLLAPYFGTSTFVWANLIGLTLAYLAVGYYVGGRIADRHPEPSIVYVLTAIAGVAISLLPVVAHPVLQVSLDAIDNVEVGAFYGSLVGVILLLAVPITLVGMVTPFVIRLRMQSLSNAGGTAGGVWALSTVGSIVGSFVPVLVLVPLVGTRWTFFILGGLLVVVSLAGLLVMKSGLALSGVAVAAVAVTGFVLVADAGEIKPPYRGELVEESESAYHYIQVLDDDGVMLLALNEGHAIHSIYDPATPITEGPWDYFAIAPLFVEPSTEVERALIIGMAGGTAARTILDASPGAIVEGVEIDPEIVRLGRKYFSLADPRIETTTSDGRFYLSKSDQPFDIIGIDAYRQPYIPFHLTTREFFEESQSKLTTNGAVVVNAGRTETDYRLVEVLASTMLSVFDTVVLLDVAKYDNTMIFGLPEGATIEAFWSNVDEIDPDSIIGTIANLAVETGDIRYAIATHDPYTDDHAPVEWLVDQMIFNAVKEESP